MLKLIHRSVLLRFSANVTFPIIFFNAIRELAAAANRTLISIKSFSNKNLLKKKKTDIVLDVSKANIFFSSKFLQDGLRNPQNKNTHSISIK